ncbi:MAG: Aldo/keto reductase [candidate division CPR2 bacterium GW2011_GWC1_41_48]|uniref:Aldo/keto reductase n=1 Tax=candidate division CPR2 bacterium GW2011_GWC1_41_48 TaxID=1618344 RepID=A0A0G0WBK6_UNCC2|nr:MAG: Aldo/keto reductase [candidate division CPR2 bacterium GW2011_GWC2_39_35]KKR28932.1 MAG: Aldo/keto reductase [candidate division CPR2 bacterium GW2011_GWD1_39_7]KKR28960.1 MAG: Aldo/keto reductase [candidate division CPR2 bacterium GW2011_GWD2_39_7]KKS09457.1 MAG: Aldo/keto reductase [candidate division CPR2 bacterium GW2011_GWC1_41_48]OGB61759.1 MAG: hypothetical protein A2Y27_02260 [candidate division CPR2 bacterium GWD1_39_7]OGB70361.1 MAG: hypothetical protein A2Y26_00085 [candidat
MKIPTKKLKNGFELPVYGLGLWEVGGRLESDISKDSEEIKGIQANLDSGVTHIDTAELYGNGHAEELLGQAIRGFDREELFIASKVGHDGKLSYDRVRKSFEASLKRIGTDYLDLYYLHLYPKHGYSIEETMKAMNELKDQGLIKNIGLSNVTPNRFKEAQKYSDHKIVCNQVHYNLQYREVEDKKVLSFCQDNDVMLVAWRPLQKGLLPESDLILKIAKKYEKTPAQIALNWLISQDSVVTIVKTSNVDHLKENLGAVDWTMEKEDIARIRKEFPNQELVSEAIPLDYEGEIAP